MINIWFQHLNSNLIKFNYNLFLTNYKNYRKYLQEILELNKVENINSVLLFGSGSSFSPENSQVQLLDNYLSRYKKYLDHDMIIYGMIYYGIL